ncbi:MAG: DnaJ domain-containing protein [Arenicellales bacterium]
MSSNLNELFAFAVDFYRAPLQHQQKLQKCRTYSSSFTRLLEIASRPDASNDLQIIASALQKSPETLVSAALFLIRQLLFTEKDSHYKVLGLQQTASQKEIKKRYRTLISLFHPDKNPEGEEWSQLYAPDLNEAYNILKNESKRSSYDLSLSGGQRRPGANGRRPARQRPVQTPRSSRSSRATSSTSGSSTATTSHRARRQRKQPYRPPSYESTANDSLWKKHPQLTIWGSALAVLVLVIVIISLRSPSYELDVMPGQHADTDGYQEPAMPVRVDASSLNETGDALNFALQKTAPSVSQASTPQNELDDSAGRSDGGSEMATEDFSAVINQYMTEEQRVQLSINKDAGNVRLETDAVKQQDLAQQALPQKPLSQKPLSQKTFPVDSAKDSDKKNTDSYEVVASTETPVLQKTADRPTAVATAAKASAVGGGSAVVKQTVADTEATEFSKERIGALIAQYIAAYDAGNLDQMTELFTDSVITEGGTGVDILRKDYSELFRKTAERSIVIQDIKSDATKGDEASIYFQAYIQVRRNFSRKWNKFSGEMQLTVVARDKGLKISALSHSVAKDK